jgi:hypothetical protein
VHVSTRDETQTTSAAALSCSPTKNDTCVKLLFGKSLPTIVTDTVLSAEQEEGEIERTVGGSSRRGSSQRQ